MTGRSTTATSASRCRASCRGGSGCRRTRARRFDRDGASGRAGRRVGAQVPNDDAGADLSVDARDSAFEPLGVRVAHLGPDRGSAAWQPAISARTRPRARPSLAHAHRGGRARAPPWAMRVELMTPRHRAQAPLGAPRARRADGRRGSPPPRRDDPRPTHPLLWTVSVVARRSRRGATLRRLDPPRFGAREIKPVTTRWAAPRSATSRHPP